MPGIGKHASVKILDEAMGNAEGQLDLHEPPDATAVLPPEFVVGADRVTFQVRAFKTTWTVGRDLQQQDTWCEASD